MTLKKSIHSKFFLRGAGEGSRMGEGEAYYCDGFAFGELISLNDFGVTIKSQ